MKNNKSSNTINGIHHVTAICSNPQKNIDFYTKLLGLRLVKLTVNFDDPTTYHLYYGDEIGKPGTLLTFFPWADAPKGYRGTSQAITTSFLVPQNSINYWKARLKNNDVCFQGPKPRFYNDEQVITFYDPDGLELELIAHSSSKENDERFWKDGPISYENGIRGFYSVTLSEEGYERTAEILNDEFGYTLIDNEGNRFRYQLKSSQSGANIIDVVCLPYTRHGIIGIGTVHHVAFSTSTDEQQKNIRKSIIDAGLNPTPVIDRTYFHSVYFREPGGVLFEVATNPPGFTLDQKVEELGTKLVLPDWLESERENLEKILPTVILPTRKNFNAADDDDVNANLGNDGSSSNK